MGGVLAAWEGAVGPEIARNAWPARFQRDGTLVVHAKDAIWGFELGHRAAEISARLPGAPPLKFVPGPLPEPGSVAPTGSPAPPAATLSQQAQAAAWAAGVEDEELRKLISRAATASLSKTSG